MKEIPAESVQAIVAYRWPSWHPHPFIETGKWQLSTWGGDAATVWIEFDLGVAHFMATDHIKRAWLLNPGESDELEDEYGRVVAVAFIEGGQT